MTVDWHRTSRVVDTKNKDLVRVRPDTMGNRIYSPCKKLLGPEIKAAEEAVETCLREADESACSANCSANSWKDSADASYLRACSAPEWQTRKPENASKHSKQKKQQACEEDAYLPAQVRRALCRFSDIVERSNGARAWTIRVFLPYGDFRRFRVFERREIKVHVR